jgi:hypothetical protein
MQPQRVVLHITQLQYFLPNRGWRAERVESGRGARRWRRAINSDRDESYYYRYYRHMKGLGEEMSDNKVKIGYTINHLDLLHRLFINHGDYGGRPQVTGDKG